MVSRSLWCAVLLVVATGEATAQRGGNQQQGGAVGGGRAGAPSAPAPSPRSGPIAAPPRAAPAPAPSPAPRPSAPAPSPSPAAGGSRGGVARPSPAPAPMPSPSAGAADRAPAPAPAGRGGVASGRGGAVNGGRSAGATAPPAGRPENPAGGVDRGRGGFNRTPTTAAPDLPGAGGTRGRGDGGTAVAPPAAGERTPAGAAAAPRTRGNYEHRGYNRGGATGGAKLADDAVAGGRGAGGTPRSRTPTAARVDDAVDRPAVRPVASARPAPVATPIRGGAAGPVAVAGGASASWAGNLYAGSGSQANLNHAVGVGTSSALLHAHYGRGYSPWYGCAPYRFDPFWSLPHWPTYTTWYGAASWTPWYAPYRGWSGYSYPCGSGFYADYRSHRWSVGFGFNVCRNYGSTWYPCYRRYSYLPFYYYSTVAFYPAYSTVYVHDVATASYADVSDPYVEYEDDVASAPAPASFPAGGGLAVGGGARDAATPATAAPVAPSGLPVAFAESLVPEYPAGLPAAEYAARADAELAAGRYFDAAEARRRAWALDPREATHPLRLGYALFAAGRYDLAAAALRAAFELDPVAHRRRESLDRVLGSAENYRKARLAVERRVFREPGDADARFVLATAAFMNADYFAARTEFNALAGKERVAEVFRDEAARRLVTDDG